jgi:uracil DNA glycosylase
LSEKTSCPQVRELQLEVTRALLIITDRSAHPSPLSAHKGFLGNGHFKLANEWLLKTYGEGIDWTALNA